MLPVNHSIWCIVASIDACDEAEVESVRLRDDMNEHNIRQVGGTDRKTLRSNQDEFLHLAGHGGIAQYGLQNDEGQRG